MDNLVHLTQEEFSTLTTKAYKYDRLVNILKKHIVDPDNPINIESLCVRAMSDEQLDEIMDIAHADDYGELLEQLNKKFSPPDPDQIKNAEQVLINNGVDDDEADVVLQALGYVLMDTELYPDDTTDKKED